MVIQTLKVTNIRRLSWQSARDSGLDHRLCGGALMEVELHSAISPSATSTMTDLANGQSLSADNNGLSAQPSITTDSLGDDEIALYDRQIRLWGVQAQEK